MPPERLTSARRKPSLLLVEADAALEERLQNLLTLHGLALLTARSGQDTMALLKHERPELILLDAALPDMPVHELVERIRTFDAHTPIVLLGNPHPADAATTGADVQARLPREVSDEALLKQLKRWLSPTPTERRTQWPGTILVVDDEPRLCAILQEFLELHGFTVQTAASGEEALERMEQTPPTVVLLDIQLCGMDGLATLKKIKAMPSNPTVIMMTGLEEEELMERALALGANDYVVKPFDLAYLESSLLSRILLGKSP